MNSAQPGYSYLRNHGKDIFFQYLPEKKLKQKELEKKSKQKYLV